jgi:hypothetical protein
MEGLHAALQLLIYRLLRPPLLHPPQAMQLLHERTELLINRLLHLQQPRVQAQALLRARFLHLLLRPPLLRLRLLRQRPLALGRLRLRGAPLLRLRLLRERPLALGRLRLRGAPLLGLRLLQLRLRGAHGAQVAAAIAAALRRRRPPCRAWGGAASGATTHCAGRRKLATRPCSSRCGSGRASPQSPPHPHPHPHAHTQRTVATATPHPPAAAPPHRPRAPVPSPSGPPAGG